MMNVHLPGVLVQVASVNSNRVVQLLHAEHVENVDLQVCEESEVEGYIFSLSDGRDVLVVAQDISNTQVDHVLKVKDLSTPDTWHTGQWLRPTVLSSSSPEDVLKSWKGRFVVIEDTDDDPEGLRPPQVGALYATLAHWRVHKTEATIVLPTGTGKTDTMLSIYTHARLNKLLVIVPTDALRTQLGEKFLTLGILKHCRLLPSEAMYPRVGYLTKGLINASEALDFIMQSNVVVATMDAITACQPEAKKIFEAEFSHMFVDEAHHLGASTWDAFRRNFTGIIVQFTATPFRRDGKRLPGKIIFNYPLRMAQEAGYFSRIQFKYILEFDNSKHDQEIAKVAIKQLELDDENGYKHVVLARCETVNKAEKVIQIYQDLAPSHEPVLLHSKLKAADREEAKRKLLEGRARIVVCVDMFGEGFDYPALKIGAMHDAHKSVGITLQFTGRFARRRNDLGAATVIANLANTKTNTPNILQKLYAEDADWNKLLHIVSSDSIHEEVKVQEFMGDFSPDSLTSVSNLSAAASVMVYDTRAHSQWTWRPERITEAFEQEDIVGTARINLHANIVFVIVRNTSRVRWGNVSNILDVTHELYIAYHHEKHDLMFVYGSGSKTKQRCVAQKLLRSNTPHTVKGDMSFRVFGDVAQLRLRNLGLRETVNRRVSFRSFMGPNVKDGIDVLDEENRVMTNVFGKGYQDGRPMDYGAARKGRIWSYRTTDSLLDWKAWCDQVAPRLRNNAYTPKQILSRALIPKKVIQVPPNQQPILVTWNEDLWDFEETRRIHINFYDGGEEPIERVALLFNDIQLRGMSENQDSFLFDVVGTTKSGDSVTASYRADITDKGMSYTHEDGCTLKVDMGKRGKVEESIADDFFSIYPPIFKFASGALLVENTWIEIKFDRSMSFNKGNIESWNWSLVDISKESAWKDGAVVSDSIQMKVLTELKTQGFDLIVNDDGAGESADVVAMRVEQPSKTLHVCFYHLKYSSETKPGARVKDLYEVCGQAQRSVHWKERITDLFDHLRARVQQASRRTPSFNRYFYGGATELRRCEYFSRLFDIEFEIFIVQPGLKKSKVSDDQLELLATTRSYLHQTLLVPLHVIASS